MNSSPFLWFISWYMWAKSSLYKTQVGRSTMIYKQFVLVAILIIMKDATIEVSARGKAVLVLMKSLLTWINSNMQFKKKNLIASNACTYYWYLDAWMWHFVQYSNLNIYWAKWSSWMFLWNRLLLNRRIEIISVPLHKMVSFLI